MKLDKFDELRLQIREDFLNGKITIEQYNQRLINVEKERQNNASKDWWHSKIDPKML